MGPGHSMMSMVNEGVPSHPVARADIARAVGAVDRELAGALELTTMFDQTRQAVVLENAEFLRFRELLAAELAPATTAALDHLYAGLPEAESAMERRGPANTLKDADRRIVENWEGDAREVQRLLRASLLQPRDVTDRPIGQSIHVPLLARIGRLIGRR